ncbi:MAG: hypothetical protein LUH05_04110 [Candidatus Gastranaerophilales bacterium]|nr:hypothetical protein [Candidatus Gastranaerophilales bacterium]
MAVNVNLKEKYSHTRAEIKEFTNKELMQAVVEAMEIQNGHYYRQLNNEIKQRNIYD